MPRQGAAGRPPRGGRQPAAVEAVTGNVLELGGQEARPLVPPAAQGSLK
jgi:hypothetical protein